MENPASLAWTSLGLEEDMVRSSGVPFDKDLRGKTGRRASWRMGKDMDFE